MSLREAETLIVGSGHAGMLVARALLRAGQSCTVVERGGMKSWEEQQKDGEWEAASPFVDHNHETDEAGLDWPWTYVYGVGGTSNRWAGTSPRFLPEDFEMKTRYDVMRDWPISYDDLLPHYRTAEEIMGVAGPETDLMPGAPYALPPHPFSPQDEAVKPYLEPFIQLPQSRPSRPSRGKAACCGSGRCQLCPVDARFSVLNSLGDVLEHPRLELLDKTLAVKLVSSPDGKRIVAVDCLDEKENPLRIEAKRVVVAANGLESAGLLLRSGLDHGDTGRYLFDHRNSKLIMRTRKPVGPGRGASLVTGASYRYYGGEHRRSRAALFLLPFNLGPPRGRLFYDLTDGIVEGRTGKKLRQEAVHRWERTLSLDVYLDDELDADNRVTLSASKDRWGIPRNRVRFNDALPYQTRAIKHILDDLPRRLRPLGVHDLQFEYVPLGGHMLGALRMGDDDRAVVDADLRHMRRENLYVSGGAVLPTYSPTHPTLTIGALAARLGAHMAEERV